MTPETAPSVTAVLPFLPLSPADATKSHNCSGFLLQEHLTFNQVVTGCGRVAGVAKGAEPLALAGVGGCVARRTLRPGGAAGVIEFVPAKIGAAGKRGVGSKIGERRARVLPPAHSFRKSTAFRKNFPAHEVRHA